MTVRGFWLRKYVEFEREMVALDANGLELDADELREVMDIIWRRLTKEEREKITKEREKITIGHAERGGLTDSI